MAICTWCNKEGPGEVNNIIHIECAIAALQSQDIEVGIRNSSTGKVEVIPESNRYI